MQSLQKVITSSILLSEISHVFCCGLPTLFSLLSLLSVLGVATVMPAAFVEFHELMHVYEVPMIVFSAVMITLGWALHMVSRAIDCRSHGCGHPPCAPEKTSSTRLLVIATTLFAINILAYAVIHQGVWDADHVTAQAELEHAH